MFSKNINIKELLMLIPSNKMMPEVIKGILDMSVGIEIGIPNSNNLRTPAPKC